MVALPELNREGSTDGASPDLLHVYEIPASRYPRPGDVALCGHVKVLPDGTPRSVADLDCVVCADLVEGESEA